MKNILLTAAIGLSACASLPADTQAHPAPTLPISALSGNWQLVAFDQASTQSLSAARLSFTELPRGNAYFGCNHMMFQVSETADGIIFGPIASTLMMCEPEQMNLERQFAQASIQGAWQLTAEREDILLLQQQNGSLLRLQRIRK